MLGSMPIAEAERTLLQDINNTPRSGNEMLLVFAVFTYLRKFYEDSQPKAEMITDYPRR